MTKAQQLERIERDCIGAANGPGIDLRDTFVFYDGNPDAKIVLVGEAPNEADENSRKPFMGAVGFLLKDALLECGLTKKMVYITNILKYRPQTDNPDKNRSPKWREVNPFRKVLLKELRIVNPAVVICLGGSALRGMCNDETLKIGDELHSEYTIEGMTVMGTYHPSYILKSGGKHKEDGVTERWAYRMLKERFRSAIKIAGLK